MQEPADYGQDDVHLRDGSPTLGSVIPHASLLRDAVERGGPSTARSWPAVPRRSPSGCGVERGPFSLIACRESPKVGTVATPIVGLLERRGVNAAQLGRVDTLEQSLVHLRTTTQLLDGASIHASVGIHTPASIAYLSGLPRSSTGGSLDGAHKRSKTRLVVGGCWRRRASMQRPTYRRRRRHRDS